MKLTNTLLLTVLLGFFSHAAHAQKCNLDVDEVDQFTKEHIKSGTNKVGGLFWHLNLTLKKTGAVYGWEMKIKLNGHVPEPIRKGDIIYCKLENDKVIQMVSDDDYAPVHGLEGNQIITQFVPKGKLTEADMKTFSESPMTEMRITLSGNKLEPNVSGRQGSALQEIARCVLMP